MRDYSDVLLMFLLKGVRPEKYRERVDIKGPILHINLKKLPDELIARLAEGENPLSVLASATPDVKREAFGLLPPAPNESRASAR